MGGIIVFMINMTRTSLCYRNISSGSFIFKNLNSNKLSRADGLHAMIITCHELSGPFCYFLLNKCYCLGFSLNNGYRIVLPLQEIKYKSKLLNCLLTFRHSKIADGFIIENRFLP